jgi:hypothetical protein
LSRKKYAAHVALSACASIGPELFLLCALRPNTPNPVAEPRWVASVASTERGSRTAKGRTVLCKERLDFQLALVKSPEAGNGNPADCSDDSSGGTTPKPVARGLIAVKSTTAAAACGRRSSTQLAGLRANAEGAARGSFGALSPIWQVPKPNDPLVLPLSGRGFDRWTFDTPCPLLTRRALGILHDAFGLREATSRAREEMLQARRYPRAPSGVGAPGQRGASAADAGTYDYFPKTVNRCIDFEPRPMLWSNQRYRYICTHTACLAPSLKSPIRNPQPPGSCPLTPVPCPLALPCHTSASPHCPGRQPCKECKDLQGFENHYASPSVIDAAKSNDLQRSENDLSPQAEDDAMTRNLLQCFFENAPGEGASRTDADDDAEDPHETESTRSPAQRYTTRPTFSPPLTND